MQQSCLASKCFFALALTIFLGITPAALASEFTIGLKAWDASLSADNLEGGDDLFQGIYFSWGINDNWSVTGGYVEGEVDFQVAGTTVTGTIEEVDADLIVHRRLTKRLEIGAGYRSAEFTTVIGGTADAIESAGPTVFLGGGALFGQSRNWGYYWGLAFMFDDMEDDDGSQEHFNGEGGIRWTANDFAVLLGYRYKEYSGDGIDGSKFDGPVLNLAYTF